MPRGCCISSVAQREGDRNAPPESGGKVTLAGRRETSARSGFNNAEANCCVFERKEPDLEPPLLGVRKRVVSKRVVLADVPRQREPERGYKKWNDGNKKRNEGTFAKPPFCKTALLFPLDSKSQQNTRDVPHKAPKWQPLLGPSFLVPHFRTPCLECKRNQMQMQVS